MTDDPTSLRTEDREALPTLDLAQIELLLGIPHEEDTVFTDYLNHIANDGLKPYKTIIQYSETEGGKPGESLYTHVLDGIFVLDQIRRLVMLDECEARVLFTAFTIHDINKVGSEKANYLKLTSRERVADEITQLKLDCFFPGFDAYLDDIISLMQRHSGHTWVGVQAYDLRYATRFKLDRERLDQLVFLMRAADGDRSVTYP